MRSPHQHAHRNPGCPCRGGLGCFPEQCRYLAHSLVLWETSLPHTHKAALFDQPQKSLRANSFSPGAVIKTERMYIFNLVVAQGSG